MYPDIAKSTLAGGVATGAAALAFTGLDIGWFVAVGLILVLTGALLWRGRRLHRVESDVHS
ncbi:hypothetical protein FEAC_19070 [Ferrimicrobium acidiphilum DSM 19497]|uniref:Uncharacterized protein n=1 Tax=Ferrimicrobium acidiphilum DSM 19497 TaxID=1121877 RepID=A0A0D8FVM9_9ACTN|nr:hypothetical protein FEAC_19070 [Ferrimicrobium acidiphilum DSM 19497]